MHRTTIGAVGSLECPAGSSVTASDISVGRDITGDTIQAGMIDQVYVGRDLDGSLDAKQSIQQISVGRKIDKNITAESGSIGPIR